MKPCYPLDVDDQREYPAGFSGRVLVWDIDKTYLATAFSSLKGLARIPVELAVDKRAIPGMPDVLRGLRWGPGDQYAGAPLYFVSASPPQLRSAVERRMTMDGVEHDGMTFKHWARCIREGRPWRLFEQVGFKVCALLAGRLRRPLSREMLFGDDAERDAEAYYLYARLLGGDLSPGEAVEAMQRAGVRSEDRRCARELLDAVGTPRGRVERVFIHLERGSPPARFAPLGPLVVPVRGAVQMALALLGAGAVREDTVARAVEAVRRADPRVDVADLVRDAVARGLISADCNPIRFV